MADQPGDLAYVWNRVIADLSGTSAGSAAALSAQQRAFLRLTRPLGLIDGTALLAAPSEFAKEFIADIKAGGPRMQELRAKAQGSQIEAVGKELRGMMPFVNAGKK